MFEVASGHTRRSEWAIGAARGDGRLLVMVPAVFSVLRLAVAVVIIVLLVRSAPVAWSNRHLAIAIWRRIRPRHVLGSLVLMVVVVGVAVGLMTFVPVTSFGLGTLVGLTGNAVFAPVEEAAARTGAATGAAPPGVTSAVTAATVAFMGLLLALFPWLAYVEEQVFRQGLEGATPVRQAWAALRFGLAHLIMLVPLAAALAIAVAGLWYGRVYVRAFRRAVVSDDLALLSQAREQAVLESTVWHTTFNSVLVALMMVAVVAEAILD